MPRDSHPTELSPDERNTLLSATRDMVLEQGEAVCIEAQRMKITAYTHGLTEGVQAAAKKWWIRGILMGIAVSVLGLFPAMYGLTLWMAAR